MKILSVHLENFASYKELDFNFDAQGLSLIHGATGSGKSTLCDAIPWGLFGVTAKNGKADEILPWNGGQTWTRIRLDINGTYLCVDRRRGPNDLWYVTSESPDPIRGKDLADTQKRINEILGMDADLYLAGAYFHEFSQTAQFFTTTLKNRRTITEQLVDLSLPLKLHDRIKLRNKDIKDEITTTDNSLLTLSAKVEMLTSMAKDTKNMNDLWSYNQGNKIAQLQAKSDTFDLTKNHKVKSLETDIAAIKYESPLSYDLRLKALSSAIPAQEEKCVTCGTPKSHPEMTRILKEISWLEEEKRNNDYNLKLLKNRMNELNDLKDSANPYLEQISDLHTQTNPHTSQLIRLEKDLDKQLAYLKAMNESILTLKDQELNLDLLSDAVTSMRSELVRNTIQDLETMTNSYLLTHFDGELRIALTILDSDKLEVSITKDSNEASFTQLSKGQRQMLKLSFGLAVMQTIQEHHALSFSQIFLDESMDGLDDTNKLKAIRMLETLTDSHDSVYLVEHSEGVKVMVDNKIYVELIDGQSNIS